MSLKHLFTAHPSSLGESYGEHARHALAFAGAMAVAALACAVHGVLPFLFTSTGSRMIRQLAQRMSERSPVMAPTPTGWNRLVGDDLH